MPSSVALCITSINGFRVFFFSFDPEAWHGRATIFKESSGKLLAEEMDWQGAWAKIARTLQSLKACLPLVVAEKDFFFLHCAFPIFVFLDSEIATRYL